MSRLHIGRLRGFPTSIDPVPDSRNLALECVITETHQAQVGSDRWTISGRLLGDHVTGVRGLPLDRALYLRDELESMASTVDGGTVHPVILEIDRTQQIFGRLISASVNVDGWQDGRLPFQIVIDELGAAGHLEHELQIVPLGERPNFRPVENVNSLPWSLICALDPNNQSCVDISWAGGFAALPAESTPQAAYGDSDLLGVSEEFVRTAATIHGPKPQRCWRGWAASGTQFLRYHTRPESSLDGGVEIWTHGTRRAWETDPQSAGAGLLRCGLRAPGDTHLRDLEIFNGLIGCEWRAADPSALWLRATANGTTWTPPRRFLIAPDGASLTKPTAVAITRNAPDGTTGAIRIDFQHEPTASKRYRASLYVVMRRGRRGVDCLLEVPAEILTEIRTPGDAGTAWAGGTRLSKVDTAATAGFRHMIISPHPRADMADGIRIRMTRGWFGLSMAIDGGTGAETLANIEHEYVDDCVVTDWAGVPIALTR